MENQHQKITGYRDLTQAEIDLMNEAKTLGNKVGEFIDKLQASRTGDAARWAATGRTDVQKGFMALIRSIAQPTTFV